LFDLNQLAVAQRDRVGVMRPIREHRHEPNCAAAPELADALDATRMTVTLSG
jgi:hypothetical protein